MNKKNFFNANPVGSLVEDLKEQEMRQVAAGFLTITETSWCDSQGQAELATLAGPGADCTLSAECNKTYSC